jgi:hypothetical protein
LFQHPDKAAGLKDRLAKTQDIDLIAAIGKTTIKLEVVNGKIETVTK